jgi:hypothetical protein
MKQLKRFLKKCLKIKLIFIILKQMSFFEIVVDLVVILMTNFLFFIFFVFTFKTLIVTQTTLGQKNLKPHICPVYTVEGSCIV